MQADLAPFAAGLPDDRGAPVRPKMPSLRAFVKECKAMSPFWPADVKKRAANPHKPVSDVKPMSKECQISFFHAHRKVIL
jgi:hypothetical protein